MRWSKSQTWHDGKNRGRARISGMTAQNGNRMGIDYRVMPRTALFTAPLLLLSSIAIPAFGAAASRTLKSSAAFPNGAALPHHLLRALPQRNRSSGRVRHAPVVYKRFRRSRRTTLAARGSEALDRGNAAETDEAAAGSRAPAGGPLDRRHAQIRDREKRRAIQDPYTRGASATPSMTTRSAI